MNIKVAVCQMNIVWQDPAANMANVVGFVERVDADMVVLPEMFSTGFAVGDDVCAEPFDGPTLNALVSLACSSSKALVGSVACTFNGKLRNRMFFITPEGRIDYYDKRHLFTFGGENSVFEAGNERKIVEYKGFRFILQICYDLRFPVFSRNCGDYDAIIYVASWPESRIGAWDALLRARAIENQAYVIAVNRVGDDPYLHYNGHSVVLDYYGNVAASTPDDQQAVESVVLDTETLDRFREKFRAWEDADRFTIDKISNNEY